LDSGGLARLLTDICTAAGATGPIIARAGVEAVRRRGAGASYLFVINHTEQEVDLVGLGISGDDLLSGKPVAEGPPLGAGRVAVVKEAVKSPAPGGE
jgi:beta-galactosidase